MTYILLDNTSGRLDAPDWVTIPTEQTLGGSVSRANNTKDFTSFTITFNGSVVDFYIIMSPFTPHNLPSSVAMTLDGGSQVWDVPTFRHENASSTDQVARHWYTTPELDDEQHTITVTDFPPHFSLDYVTVFTARESSSINELVIVDDTKSIKYTGHWSQNFQSRLVVSLPFSEDHLSLEPYMGAASGGFSTWGVLTAATYNFTGTSIFVYGILAGPLDGCGNMTVVYTIDGLEPERIYIAGGPHLQANYLWFWRTGLPLAPHTIQFTMLENHRLNFTLDYLIVGARPYITSNHAPAWTPSVLNPFPVYGNGIPIKTNWTLPNATTVETWGYTKSSQVSKSTVIGVSISVVVGALIIGGILLFWFRYRARRKRVSNSDDRRDVPFAIY